MHQVGETHRVDCDTGEVLEAGTASTEGMAFHHFHVGNTFPDPQGGVVDNPNQLCAYVLYEGVTQNPLILSPDINIALFFTVDPLGRTVSVRGAVKDFPDYEVYARADGGSPMALVRHNHGHDPAGGLRGGADQPVPATVSI